MGDQKRRRDPSDKDDDGEQPSRKSRPTRSAPSNRFYPSFCTTACIYSQLGVAIINKVCLDSGFEARGAVGNINPSVIEQFGLDTYSHKTTSIIANGEWYTTLRRARLPLTFESSTGNITLKVELNVNLHDNSSYQILLSVGVLHLLGGVHDFRVDPPCFQVTDPESKTLVYLMPCSHLDMPSTRVIWKTDAQEYVEHILLQPGFLHQGTKRALPKHALAGLDTSKELQPSSTFIAALVEKYTREVAYSKDFRAAFRHAINTWVSMMEVAKKMPTLVESGVEGTQIETA